MRTEGGERSQAAIDAAHAERRGGPTIWEETAGSEPARPAPPAPSDPVSRMRTQTILLGLQTVLWLVVLLTGDDDDWPLWLRAVPFVFFSLAAIKAAWDWRREHVAARAPGEPT